MHVNQRPIEKKFNNNSDGTPIGTPDAKFEDTLMCNLLNVTSSYVNLEPSVVISKA